MKEPPAKRFPEMESVNVRPDMRVLVLSSFFLRMHIEINNKKTRINVATLLNIYPCVSCQRQLATSNASQTIATFFVIAAEDTASHTHSPALLQ